MNNQNMKTHRLVHGSFGCSKFHRSFFFHFSRHFCKQAADGDDGDDDDEDDDDDEEAGGTGPERFCGKRQCVEHLQNYPNFGS